MMTTFILNKYIILCIIPLLPVIWKFLLIKHTKRTMIFGLFFIYLFISGSLELLGVNITILRALNELVILFGFLKLIINKKPLILPGIIYVILFLFISFLSLINTSNNSLILLLIYFLTYIEIILFFYTIINIKFTDYENHIITKLIFSLVVAQIFAAIIKILLLGGLSEAYIGTMAIRGGTLTTLFSLSAFSFTLVHYFIKKNKKYLWLAFGFIIFAIAGEKRAAVFYIPLFLIITAYITTWLTSLKTISISSILLTILLLPLIFYIMVRVNPSFNPERKIWGSFDLDYTLNFSQDYMEGYEQTEDAIGRGAAFGYIHNKMLSENLSVILFGYGAGDLIQSRFNTNLSNYKGSKEYYSLQKYGVGYGIAPGYLKILIQSGFLGIISYLLFYFFILKKNISKLNRKYKLLTINELIVCIGSIIILISSIFIFITYADVPFTINAVSVASIWIVSRGYKLVNN